MAGNDIGAIVITAVATIKKLAEAIGATNSGIDETQIKDLRTAIDELEVTLNQKKRDLDAAS